MRGRPVGLIPLRGVLLLGVLQTSAQFQDNPTPASSVDSSVLSAWGGRSCSTAGISCNGDKVQSIDFYAEAVNGPLPDFLTLLDEMTTLYARTGERLCTLQCSKLLSLPGSNCMS